jgi:L,D-peptidoglycan transpeptidase YkuD (ErfK/YbiS/YcfS/YnhG family)
VLVALSLASACGSGDDNTAAKVRTPSTTVSSTTTPVTVPPSTVAPVPATTLPAPTTSSSSSQSGATSPVDHLVGVGSAGQVISVIARDYGQTSATLTAYERVGGEWRVAFGPWEARLGTSGFAPPGAKREGDGRTPSGAYGFDFFFGVQPDPGVHFAYRVVTSTAIVWDDDPGSALYNEWVDTTSQNAGADPEPMYNVPAYSFGAVIAYNSARTPGLGSAIFLHVGTGGPTAGCVSLPAGQLLDVLRWLDPSRQPRIVMGTTAGVTS